VTEIAAKNYAIFWYGKGVFNEKELTTAAQLRGNGYDVYLLKNVSEGE
jgi:hypothetical protein